MEAGDLMYGFWWELFDKIRHSEDWKDALSLNISLQECIEASFAKDMYRLVDQSFCPTAKRFLTKN